ncbi:ATP-NAD kinase [Denitrobacterium detoxificans]|uniref:NAD kinase n=1 Tax=Denitrobacterium detoxificans TaxID=79604 RepID=A0A172RYV3_9ACTN|nr:NAD(+)/NADH kinase [Denitrobacterium detoxificans]ANE22910.1 ATP-NAD kinase [Denitrobacterium detoxificans]SEO71434.1 NAD+ kinase [Denitrobacterium detoxificans]
MHILVVRNDEGAKAIDASLMISAYLTSQGITCSITNSIDVTPDYIEGADMAVALGGDGTILRTAHIVGYTGIPILGINFGHLGFLANDPTDSVIAMVASALAGECTKEERTNLRISVLCEGDDEDAFDHLSTSPFDRSNDRSFFALNEICVSRGASGRIIGFDVAFNGDRLANMRGDGMVVASATGSTAYALSAGGPLIAPGFQGLVVVPLAPHSISARAVVTDPNDIVDVTLFDTPSEKDATLFIDGWHDELPAPIRAVRVQRGSTPTTLLRCNYKGFYVQSKKAFF